MIEQKVSKLNDYFEGQIALCGQRNKELLADERMDEATFEMVKANVYDIFRAILSVAVKTCKGDPDAVQRFFVQRQSKFPQAGVLRMTRPNSITMRSRCALSKSSSTRLVRSRKTSQRFGRE